jgi:hypothetical protein
MKHKHSEIIKAWADGIKCEFEGYEHQWYLITDLSMFDIYNNVRIKPEPAKVLSWGEGCWVIGGNWRVNVKNKPQSHEIKNAKILLGWEWEDKK